MPQAPRRRPTPARSSRAHHRRHRNPARRHRRFQEHARTATGVRFVGFVKFFGSARPSSLPGRPSSSSRLNVDALRSITDDSGGRTEIIMSARDLDPATAGIASELSRQYFLGYSTSSPRDGRWHNIEVRVKRGNYTIRARRGFIAARTSLLPQQDDQSH
jgi:hypothetical protein